MEHGIRVCLGMLCCLGNVLAARSLFLSENTGVSEVSKKDKSVCLYGAYILTW